MSGRPPEERAEAWLAYLRERRFPRFFLEPLTRETLARVGQEAAAADPEGAAYCRRLAEHALRWELPSGSNPDFTEFLRVDRETFDFKTVYGRDPQFVQASGRMAWFPALAQLYWVDGERAECFQTVEEYWDHFERVAPEISAAYLETVDSTRAAAGAVQPPHGILDIFIRLRNWVITFFLLLPAREMSPELCERWLERILRLFELVAASGIRNQEHNFTAMQIEGLYFTARLFPEIEGMESWRRFLRGTLQATILRAFREDGGHWEQSPNYHDGCLVWYGGPLLLGVKNGETWSDLVLERLEKATDFLEACILPDGCLAPFGDSDRRPNWRNSFPLMSALLPGKQFARPIPPSFAAVWMGVPPSSTNETAPPKSPTTLLFPDSGYAIVRPAGTHGSSYLGFRNGPTDAGHAHADNLSFFWDAFGAPALADSGRWLYDGSHRQSRAMGVWGHNSLFPDHGSGAVTPEQMEGAVGKNQHLQAIFTHGDLRRGTILTENLRNCVRIRSAFRGYRADPVAEAERTVFVSTSEETPWLLVLDRFRSTTPLRWVENWMVTAENGPEVEADARFQYLLPGNRRLCLRCASGEKPLARLEQASYWCPNYGEPDPARQLVFSGETDEGLRAFLFAVTDAEKPPPDLALHLTARQVRWRVEDFTGDFPV